MTDIAIIQFTTGNGLTLIPTQGSRLDGVFAEDLRKETKEALDRAAALLGEEYDTIQTERGVTADALKADALAALAKAEPDPAAREAMLTDELVKVRAERAALAAAESPEKSTAQAAKR